MNRILRVSLLLLLTFQSVFGLWGGKEDATFKKLYPKPFHKTTEGKILINGGMLVGTVTATMLSGPIGTAGALAIATEIGLTTAIELLPEDNYQGKYTMIKIPLPKEGGDIYENELENLEKINEKFLNKEFNDKEYFEEKNKKLKDILSKIHTHTGNDYDYLNKAIIEFNLGLYEESKKTITTAQKSFDKKSYIYYHLALLGLVEGDMESAKLNLLRSLKEEKSLKPYLLLSMIYDDENKKAVSLNLIREGLEDYDDNSFELNNKAGDYVYGFGDYQAALGYYEEALSNITVNEMEAQIKIKIANCHYKLGNKKEFLSSAYDALTEIDDKASQYQLLELLVVDFKEKK